MEIRLSPIDQRLGQTTCAVTGRFILPLIRHDVLPPPNAPMRGTSVSTQVVTKLPNALPIEVASAYCNQGHLVQTRAGEDYALLAEGISLFQRYVCRIHYSLCLRQLTVVVA